MKRTPARSAARQALAVLLLVMYLPGCTFWQATTTPLPELTGPPNPAPALRITTTDGERVEVQEPRVHLDTLIGGAVPDTGWIYLPLASIRKVESRQRNVLKTIGGIALLVGIVYAIAVLCTDVTECSSE
jgi:hypothetical protein